MAKKMFSKWHRWSIKKRSQNYEVMIVEPLEYDPAKHADIFVATMESILGTDEELDPFEAKIVQVGRTAKHFDHLIFPEAFLFYKDFKKALPMFIKISSFGFGCVHIGLRSDNTNSHLFSHKEITEMIDELGSIPGIVTEDMDEFEKWIESENSEAYFNIACLFTVDTDNKLRLCFHPKVVKSNFENSALPERNMTEANMYNLVVLAPNDNLHTIAIQPLICSDVVLKYHSKYDKPFDAINSKTKFTDRVPDQVDIVSIVSCTPQKKKQLPKLGEASRKWHPFFRNSFESMMNHGRYSKHQSATYIISNYQQKDEKPYGLSGVFVPHSLPTESIREFPPDIHIHLWGSFPDGEDFNWLFPKELPQQLSNDRKRNKIKRYILAVAPNTGTGANLAKILEFTISILPSHLGVESLEKTYINNVKLVNIDTKQKRNSI